MKKEVAYYIRQRPLKNIILQEKLIMYYTVSNV